MQRQEINLYRPFDSPSILQSSLSWRHFWLFNLFFFCLFILMYFISLWDLHSLKNTRANMILNIAKLEKNFFDKKLNYPQMFFNQDTSQSVDEMEKQLVDQEKIIRSIINHVPFTKHLEALSNDIVPNVWLTEINIAERGQQISLKGKSTSGSSLQTFISNLTHDKLFSTFNLNVNNIETADKEAKDKSLTFIIDLTKTNE